MQILCKVLTRKFPFARSFEIITSLTLTIINCGNRIDSRVHCCLPLKTKSEASSTRRLECSKTRSRRRDFVLLFTMTFSPATTTFRLESDFVDQGKESAPLAKLCQVQRVRRVKEEMTNAIDSLPVTRHKSFFHSKSCTSRRGRTQRSIKPNKRSPASDSRVFV